MRKGAARSSVSSRACPQCATTRVDALVVAPPHVTSARPSLGLAMLRGAGRAAGQSVDTLDLCSVGGLAAGEGAHRGAGVGDSPYVGHHDMPARAALRDARAQHEGALLAALRVAGCQPRHGDSLEDASRHGWLSFDDLGAGAAALARSAYGSRLKEQLEAALSTDPPPRVIGMPVMLPHAEI